jgi:hypothetical protein
LAATGHIQSAPPPTCGTHPGPSSAAPWTGRLSDRRTGLSTCRSRLGVGCSRSRHSTVAASTSARRAAAQPRKHSLRHPRRSNCYWRSSKGRRPSNKSNIRTAIPRGTIRGPSPGPSPNPSRPSRNRRASRIRRSSRHGRNNHRGSRPGIRRSHRRDSHRRHRDNHRHRRGSLRLRRHDRRDG